MKFLKENKIVIILLLVASLPLFSIFQQSSKSDWKLSLKPEDKKPFGTFVFDSLMRNHFKNEYQNSRNTLYEIHLNSNKSKTIIILSDYLNLPKADIEDIKKNANNGNKYIFAFNNTNEDFSKEFEIDNRNYQTVNPFWNSLSEDSVFFKLSIIDENSKTVDSLKIEDGILNSYFIKTKENSKVLLSSESEPIAIKISYGSGSITICLSPYLFTNYFLLNKNCWKATNHLLTDINTSEIYFASKYLINDKNNSSIFKNLLYNNALKSMFYFSIILILVFIIFSAKRKQRIIPIINQHKNNSLKFIKLIGRLYFLKKNHTDLGIKKFNYLKDYLSRTYQINFNTEDREWLFQVISIKTGIEKKSVRQLFVKMEKLATSKASINEKMLHQLIEEMEQYYIKK
ncbi:MAG: DUF4350 domain-containing protein [Bacteroidota bacterium]